jgi:hypothetical protein
MHVYLIIYSSPKKKFYRLLSWCSYELGYENSYGWEIIAIYTLYDNRFVTRNDFHRLITEKYEKEQLRKKRIEKYITTLELIRNAL